MGCHLHRSESAAGTCRSCSEQYCEDCLVYAFGPGKQPYCIDCAVAASTNSTWDDRRRLSPDRR
jgi:hypothetical protein